MTLWNYRQFNKGSDDPIWPRRYKANDDSWGHHHSNEYKKKYGVRAHDLRSFAITKLKKSIKTID